MQQVALPLRNDTMLGVCEALGQDFGIHPNVLRIVFASTFYFSPLGVIATYLALGLVVATSRRAFPDARRTLSRPAETQANDDTALRLAA